MKKIAKTLVDETMAQVTTYALAQARELHGRAHLPLVGTRDLGRLEPDGVLPGALHGWRDARAIGPDPGPAWPACDDTEFVLFGADGWRSAQATRTLIDRGVMQVERIDGGFMAVKEAGAPIAPDVSPADPATPAA